MRLSQKVAIVTGGASGLGGATAECFAKEGAMVVVADVLEREGQEIRERIVKAGGTAVFVKLDVTDAVNWTNVVDETVATFGKLDILVNSAGVSGGAGEDVLDLSSWDRLMEINARGTFHGHRTAIPVMKAGGGGSIVNISSVAAIIGQDKIHAGYSASKGAVRSLTKSVAVQFGRDNIRVNSVHPGMMPPMRTSVAAANTEFRAKLLPSIPLGRAGVPNEVAYAVLFLASDEASYITGVELYVDGGFLAQ